jgi:hypothetical protein
MKRMVRLIVLFVLALPFVPFLPLYIERTLLRSWRVDRAGDQIDWGWKLTSLVDYWSDYNYMQREQRPSLWLQIDIALAIVYALLFAIALDQVFAWRQKRKTSSVARSTQP